MKIKIKNDLIILIKKRFILEFKIGTRGWEFERVRSIRSVEGQIRIMKK